MKSTKTGFILLIFFIFIFAGTLRAEYVFLKDGSILKCKIENETAASITIRLPDNKLQTINPKNVMRILFTDLYMGKIFVNKTDGTVIEAYMVDEDQNTYTFRKDLYKPQEFTLRRDEVLFTTRKNPTGLTGTAKSDVIMISWKPPYTPVKNFRIYIKSGAEYKMSGESNNTDYILKGLKSNTLYMIKVTAIDKDGYESLPSNEIKITTLNIPPDPPKGVKCVRKVEGSQMTAALSWQAGIDPDGKVKGYNIYRKNNKAFTQAGTTSDTSFDVKGLSPDINYYFTVRTVDDKNMESANSRTVNTLDLKGYDLSLEPVFILPIGKFNDVNKIGFGVLASGIKKNFLLDSLDLGVALGFWYFNGATDVDTSFMMPLMLSAAYRFEIAESLFLAPELFAGMSYNYLSYKVEPDLYTGYGLTKVSKTKQSIEPIGMAGLSLTYDTPGYWFFGAGAHYGIVYEKSEPMMFIEAEVLAGRKF